MTEKESSMAKRNHTRAALATKSQQQRQLTVQRGFYDYQGRQHHLKRSDITEILLKGKWLHQAGFQAGETVSIKVMHECIVIVKKE
jgi:hypothetical protein